MAPTDAELLVAARDGDRDAFAAIYDRYADRLYDFCWGLLRDRDEAADAVHDAFLLASQRFGQVRDPEKLRAWLFAIARHEATRRGKARARAAPTEQETFMAVPDAGPSPEESAARDELVALVWDAAAGLDQRDRVVMELSVRQGLDTTEIADAIGVGAGHASVLVTRMRERVERSLGALLVARLGRRDCPDLRRILEGWDGAFTIKLRKRVARHADECKRCDRKRSGMLSPLTLLTGVAAMAAPAGLRERVLDDAQLVGAHAPATGGGWGRDGFPPPMRSARGPRRRTMGAAAATLVIVALAIGGASMLPESATTTTTVDAASPALGDPSPPMTASPSPTAATSPTPSPTPTPTPTPTPSPAATIAPAPAQLLVSVGSIDFGETDTSRTIEIGNPGGEQLAWSASVAADALQLSPSSGTVPAGESATLRVMLDRSASPEGANDATLRIVGAGSTERVAARWVVERAPVIVDVTSSQEGLRPSGQSACPEYPSDTTEITATITDESRLGEVVLLWEHGRMQDSETMNPRGGDRYSATLGPFDELGTVTYRVRATDARGNTTTSDPATIDVSC